MIELRTSCPLVRRPVEYYRIRRRPEAKRVASIYVLQLRLVRSRVGRSLHLEQSGRHGWYELDFGLMQPVAILRADLLPVST